VQLYSQIVNNNIIFVFIFLHIRQLIMSVCCA